VNNSFDKATAMAISDGKILAIGTNDEITNKFKSDNTIDAKGKFMYPGLIDALSFYSYGLSLQEVDLRGTKSMDEVISRIQTFQKRENLKFIVGNGWDQNDWVKEFPSKAILDKYFPNISSAK
jgi:predicted amidohydrolase YtcJ